MERVVCKRLVWKLEVEGGVASTQYAYRRQKSCVQTMLRICNSSSESRNRKEYTVLTVIRVFSQHFGNMTGPLELGIFASFYTKLGKNTPYNKNKNIKHFVYSTSYSSLTHKQILKSDLQSDLPFVVGAQKNPLIKMVLLSTHNIQYVLLEKY